jgi:UDP-N-acetyl-2-amino-2-deoxyglucuronate dehydrogenase
VDLEGSISILGSTGMVEIGGFAVNEMKRWHFAKENEEDEHILKDYSVNPPDVYGFGHHAYLEHVVDCIDNGNRKLVGGLEGRKSLELIMAIYESVETGKEIFLRYTPEKCKLGRVDGK